MSDKPIGGSCPDCGMQYEHAPDCGAKRLTAPLPDDLEAELQAAIARAFERRDELDNYTRIDLLLAEEIRPLLQRSGGRADDGEPVTEDWLRSVGFTRDDCPYRKLTFNRADALPIGLWQVTDGWKAVLILGEHASANIVRQQNTRGDVRRLCAALGVPLKEAT